MEHIVDERIEDSAYPRSLYRVQWDGHAFWMEIATALTPRGRSGWQRVRLYDGTEKSIQNNSHAGEWCGTDDQARLLRLQREAHYFAEGPNDVERLQLALDFFVNTVEAEGTD